MVRVMAAELRDLLLTSGLTLEEIRQAGGPDVRISEDMLGGIRPVRMSTVAAFVRALGKKNFYQYVVPEDRPAADHMPMPEPPQSTLREIHEWVESATLTDWRTTSNGMQYQIVQMKHKDHPGRLGRGKVYDLRVLPDNERQRRRTQLLRHPEICLRLAGHKFFPINEKTTSVDRGRLWWVIDRWVEGTSLEERLEAGPLTSEQLPRVTRQILEALAILHENDILRRELSPEFIVLAEPDDSVILTDFELGKLLDKSPTVSGEWKVDKYRAEEVAVGKATVRSDLYSWARIVVHAALGDLPDPGEDVAALDDVKLKPSVRRVIAACLERNQDRRPTSAEDVMKALTRWK
jgi:serine/threonine protein kinase